jgi:allantoinase
VHAENDQLVRHFSARSNSDGMQLRPPVIEATAIAVVALLAQETNVRVHIAHISSRAALDAIEAGRALGAQISAETCPQYLALDESVARTAGAVAKITPPLRQREDVEALWEALATGRLSVVASDHSPFLPREKATAWAVAPQGLPTVELLMPVTLDGAARGRLPLADAVAAVTSTPARLFGLYPRKGVVALGADADLALVALGQEFLPGPDTLLTRAAGCAVVFAGLKLSARVEHTIVNGTVVYTHGRMSAANAGLFVPGPAATEEPILSVP